MSKYLQNVKKMHFFIFSCHFSIFKKILQVKRKTGHLSIRFFFAFFLKVKKKTDIYLSGRGIFIFSLIICYFFKYFALILKLFIQTKILLS